MNTPGVSIFQSLDAIKVNSTLERAEEEEAEEDQRRRNKELGHLLLNAFDDLADNESTMDTSSFQSEEHLEANHVQTNPILPRHNNDDNQYGNEVQHLKMLLESRTNEFENLKRHYNTDNKKIDELQKKLTITQAELDRALSTKNSTYELLVESKEKCSNLENTIAKLKNEKKTLETDNNSLVGKLETTQTMLSDVQRKYDMVERDLNKHNERNAEIRRKHMEDRHRAELEILRQQMEQIGDKLDKKSNELENMSARYHALQNTHEIMLVDKTNKITDLSNALDAAQQRCEELSCKADSFHENVRLQKLIANLQAQIESMERTIATLTDRLEQTTAELDVMDNVLQQHSLDDSPRRLSHTRNRVVGSTPLTTVDRMTHLKDELYRALANVKSKREEIRQLQSSLEEKNIELRQLRSEENQSLVQLTTLKEEKIRLENRLKVLEEELSQHDPNTKDVDNTKIRNLNDQFESLQSENLRLVEEITDLREQLSDHNAERKKMCSEIENLKVDVDETKQEYEQMKLNFKQLEVENQNLLKKSSNEETILELERHKSLLTEARIEIDRLKNLYVEICHEKEVLSYEIEKFRNTDSIKELQLQREKVSTLQRALQSAEIKSSELGKTLEATKLCHERDIHDLREKYEKERLNQDLKNAKENTNDCTKCIDLMTEVTKFEVQNLKLNNLISAQKTEIDGLSTELRTSKTLMGELTEKLKINAHQEQLIKELKTKARLFEEYIKTQNTFSDRSSTSSKYPQRNSSTPSSDKGVGTSPELEKTSRRNIEARVREEMAKLFAGELKHLQERADQLDAQNLCLRTEYQHVTTELQHRQNEVEILKQAMLAERERMEEILKEKDLNSNAIIEKHKTILHRCRDEIQDKTKRITDLVKELDERQIQIEAERKSMKAVMTQWETQRKQVDDIEEEWRKKLEILEKTHTTSLTSWQTKYSSAKRTAANYKRYAEDKEAHMLKEYERIKMEYDASLAKIEIRTKEILGQKNRELKEIKGALGRQRNSNMEDKENHQNN